MDNGQKTQNVINGSLVPNPNADLDNLGKVPDLVENPTWTPEHDTKSLGGQAIFSSEALTQNPESAPQSQELIPEAPEETPDNPNKLGEIVDLNQPPEIPKLRGDDTSTDTPAFDKNAIRITNNRLSSSAITEVNRAKSRLGQTGDASSFYDEIRDMMEQNLENSFNRKLAE